MESISEVAARWAVRIDASALGPDEQRELDTWLAVDARHLGAYVRARAQWLDLNRLAALNGIARGFSRSEVEAAAEQFIGWRASWGHVVSRRQMLAASVATLTVAGGWLSWTELRKLRERYISDVGEVRRIALADGSTMILNTDTEVAVQISEQRRNIKLFRGEALFEVARDKKRPFVVRANNIAVSAVGTAFAVRLEEARVAITVTEGVVEVRERTPPSGLDQVAPSTPRASPKRVGANQRVIVTRAGASEIHSLAVAETNRQMAWREGLVSFDGESLQTAVAEINRHNRRQIVIDDPVLAAIPVVGIFRATDLEGFSAAAAAALKARAIPDGDVIRLQSGIAKIPN